MTGNDPYDAHGELLTFEVATDGRVVTARFAMEPIFPVVTWDRARHQQLTALWGLDHRLLA